MISLLLVWLFTAGGVVLAAQIIPGVKVRSFGAALAVAAVFGILNALLGWLLFIVLGIATLGIGFLLGFLTTWSVNTIVLRLTDALVEGFTIPTWGKTALTALLLAIAGSVARAIAD